MSVPLAAAWLSKSDLAAFIRCQQGFVLLKTRRVNATAAEGTAVGARLESGTAFDRRVRDAGTPVIDADGEQLDLTELFRTDVFVYCGDRFENIDLCFVGIPDGINAAHGALEPLEIKHRSTYSDFDLFELAFYWLLLEPHRTRPAAQPAGWLQLRDSNGDAAEPFRLEIPDEMIDTVHRYAAGARAVLAQGIEPYWCNCSVCSQQLLPATTPEFRSTAPVRMVNDIGAVHATALGAVGITRIADLLVLDASEIRNRLQDSVSWSIEGGPIEGSGVALSGELSGKIVQRRGVPSLSTIGKWRLHAEAFVAGEIRMRPGRHPELPEQFIAIDLEYRPEPPKTVWSLCVQTSGISPSHRLTVVADADHQGQLIEELAEFLSARPTLPVLTWNGTSADIPMLDSVASQYPMPATLDVSAMLRDLKSRHLDLHRWTKKAVLLPIPGIKLKDVAEHFGVVNTAPGIDGFLAGHQWERYQHDHDDAVRDELIAYNRSDVALLADVANRLRSLQHPGPEPMPRRLFDVDDLRIHQKPLPRTPVARTSMLLRRIGRRVRRAGRRKAD